MPENLLRALQLLVVLVLYLFFARVLRAVWTELHPPKLVVASAVAAPNPARAMAAAPASMTGPANQVTVVEPPALRGSSWRVTDQVTVGRAPSCGIPLAEPTVSSLHARLVRQGAQMLVEDVGSRNGTFVNRERISAARPVQAGDRLGIGPVVVLEVGS